MVVLVCLPCTHTHAHTHAHTTPFVFNVIVHCCHYRLWKNNVDGPVL